MLCCHFVRVSGRWNIPKLLSYHLVTFQFGRGRWFGGLLGTERHLPPPPREQDKISSVANSGSIHPYGRYGHAVKTSETMSTITILWSVKAIFEKRTGGGRYFDFPWASYFFERRRGWTYPEGSPLSPWSNGAWQEKSSKFTLIQKWLLSGPKL